MVTSGPPYTEEVLLPEVSRAKPVRTVAEIACWKIARETKSDPFGKLGARETGGRVSKRSDAPSQTV